MGRLAVFHPFPPSRSRFPACRHCPASSRLSRRSPPFPSLINTSRPIGRVPVRPISSPSFQSSLFQVRLCRHYYRHAYACFITGTPTPALLQARLRLLYFRYATPALFQERLRLLYSRYAYACFIPGTPTPALFQVRLRLLYSRYDYACFIPGTPTPALFSKVALESYTAKKIRFYVLPEKKLHGLSPNFHIHVSVSDIYISTIGPPIFVQQNRQKVGIYKCLQKHECRNWAAQFHFWVSNFRYTGFRSYIEITIQTWTHQRIVADELLGTYFVW